jgi:hypothetical protein
MIKANCIKINVHQLSKVIPGLRSYAEPNRDRHPNASNFSYLRVK